MASASLAGGPGGAFVPARPHQGELPASLSSERCPVWSRQHLCCSPRQPTSQGHPGALGRPEVRAGCGSRSLSPSPRCHLGARRPFHGAGDMHHPSQTRAECEQRVPAGSQPPKDSVCVCACMVCGHCGRPRNCFYLWMCRSQPSTRFNLKTRVLSPVVGMTRAQR